MHEQGMRAVMFPGLELGVDVLQRRVVLGLLEKYLRVSKYSLARTANETVNFRSPKASIGITKNVIIRKHNRAWNSLSRHFMHQALTVRIIPKAAYLALLF